MVCLWVSRATSAVEIVSLLVRISSSNRASNEFFSSLPFAARSWMACARAERVTNLPKLMIPMVCPVEQRADDNIALLALKGSRGRCLDSECRFNSGNRASRCHMHGRVISDNMARLELV